MNPWRGSQIGAIDDILDPADTRPRVIQALRALQLHKGGRA